MEKDLVDRLEAAVSRLEKLTTTGSHLVGSSANAKGAAQRDKAALAFDDMTETYLSKVLAVAEKIGGKVLEATRVLEEAFMVEKDLLCRAKQFQFLQKPRMEDLGEFLKPLNEVIMRANALIEGKGAEFFNHLKTIADSLTALGWIAYSGKGCGMSLPTAHVEESWQMAEFYNNKILVEYKNKDADHVEWAKAFKELYSSGLRNYVKEFYPLGPEWGTAGSITSTAPTMKAPNPPPSPSPLMCSQTATSRPKEGMSAIFQEITSGKSVTAGLRKVTDDMKSKNRTDRAGVVSATEKQDVSSTSFSSSKTGPPKFELQLGRKWVVEYQIGIKNLTIDDCDSKQSVYVFGCKDSVLQVKGKVNNITLDKCTKTGIVFTDVVAAFEIVNCNALEVQCQGSAPTISIDNTSGSQIYLSKASLETSITTAKSSEINVLIPGEGADDDWAEHPLPQQFVHILKDGHFTTSPVSHSGA